MSVISRRRSNSELSVQLKTKWNAFSTSCKSATGSTAVPGTRPDEFGHARRAAIRVQPALARAPVHMRVLYDEKISALAKFPPRTRRFFERKRGGHDIDPDLTKREAQVIIR